VEEGSYSFGPYSLSAQRRSLLNDGQPISLGSRALDLLLLLVARAGEVVSKEELIAGVWPDTYVEDSNLRVHIAGLRRALGEGRSGSRYVVNVPGRGYSFAASVILAPDPVHEFSKDASPAPVARTAPARNGSAHHLPVRLVRTIGRSAAVAAITRTLPTRRFMTVVGPGGIGKTTVGLAVAEDLGPTYADGAHFVDLSTISDPSSLPAAIAATLGLPLPAEDQTVGLARGLSERHMLILLDNCEHVLSEAAEFAEAVLRAAPNVQLLATSREPLRAEGEWIYRLGPLEVPPEESRLSVEQTLGYSAVELFMERATARVDGFALTDDGINIVADICRRLDGVPLAIELAAASVDTFGLNELARQLQDRFAVLTRGRRTALARHQTLRATLDWSYEILSERERIALRRLSVFRGRFTAAAAAAVLPRVDPASADCASVDLTDAETPGILLDLVAKSLLMAEAGQTVSGYRLLETTRTYASERLTESGERDCVSRNHAAFLLDFLDGPDVERESEGSSEWRETYSHLIDDIRSAFDWAYSEVGDTEMGVILTIRSSPIWFCLSLMSEFRQHLTQALARLEPAWTSVLEFEMRLNEALGHANWHVSGPGPEMGAALRRALELAEQVRDTHCQRRAIWGIWSERNVCGDYREAARLADMYSSPALGEYNQAELFVSLRMLALSNHFVGRQMKAREHAEQALLRASDSQGNARLSAYQFDLRVGTQSVLSRILWLNGFPDQAVRTAHAAVDRAFELGHTLSQCFALYSACMVAIWVGDYRDAANHAGRLVDRAEKHALAFWAAWGRGYEQALSMAGKAGGFDRATWCNPICGAQLAEVMVTLSPAFLDADLLERIEASPENWCTPEVLRAQGEVLLTKADAGAEDAAEVLFRRSLAIGHDQDALSWELRSATSLARLLQRQNRDAEALCILGTVLERITEGAASADLVIAKDLFANLNTAGKTL